MKKHRRTNAQIAIDAGRCAKMCPHCGEVKPFNKFYRNPDGMHGLAARCADCWKEYAKQNPDVAKKSRLKLKYGLTVAQWETLFEGQGRRCAICQGPSPGVGAWHTDHCHSTGKVRGILCRGCNHLLGNAADDACTLLAAAAYLRERCEIKLQGEDRA